MTNGSRVHASCHGFEVDRSESMETRSPDEARQGWRMANDWSSLHYLCVLDPLDFAAPTSNFHLIRVVFFLFRVKTDFVKKTVCT